jgi:energy-coupling factor transporter ATP-binding protein EcfA2
VRAVIEQFSYDGERSALSGIDVSLRAGELVVIAGPSGGGKTTLAQALAGLIPHRIRGAVFEGSVRFERPGGEPVELTSLPLHLAAQYVGIVFQNPEYQLIQYQVDAEVAFGPENLGLPHDEVVERVTSSLCLVGATELAGQAISSLSGGQKQRVAIAAALAMSPPVLVLDEPTSDLDPVGTEEVVGVLRRLSHENGKAVVAVEHKLDELAPYADRVLLLVGGRIIVDDHPRRAFVPTARFEQAGARPPELVRLAELLPEHFGGSVPLSVAEAARGLEGVSLRADPELGHAPQALPEPGAGRCDAAPPALEVIGVTVSFQGRRALDDVTLRVADGEWVALIGANGSGKTTLGATLMGFVKPEAGSASCFGEPVVFGRISKQADRLGYLFQNVDEMLFGETVAAELDFTRRHRVPVGEHAPSAEEVAGIIGLAERAGSHPYALSGGERERLGLGALLTRGPRGLILDEPTTGLDEVHAVALFDLLARIRRRRSLTCLLITHDMRLVARCADRVVVMNEGRIVLDTTPRRAFAAPQVLEGCGVRPPAISALHHRLVTPAPDEVAVSAEELARLVRPAAAALQGGGSRVASS